MIGIFIQTSGGGAERKEKTINWEMAPYVGLGKYLLYSNMPNTVNLHHSVVLQKHKDNRDTVIPNCFNILINGENLEVIINDHKVSGRNDTAVTELQGGVYLRRHMSHRILSLEEGVFDVELKIIHNINNREIELARAKLAQASREHEIKAKRKEYKVDAKIWYRSTEGFDL